MKAPLHVLDLGTCPYRAALQTQEQIVAQRKAGQGEDTLILVEHPPVYTLGRNAETQHVLYNDAERRERGIALEHTSRGGDVTYHGPGQLVGYPILALGRETRRVVRYVSQLEEALIRTLADFGVDAVRDRANRGVWVGSDKIAALGVRVTEGVTMHGFALNVRTDLAHYDGIVPCGIRGKGVTSLHLSVPSVTLDEAKMRIAQRFAETFGYATCRAVSATELGRKGE